MPRPPPLAPLRDWESADLGSRSGSHGGPGSGTSGEECIFGPELEDRTHRLPPWEDRWRPEVGVIGGPRDPWESFPVSDQVVAGVTRVGAAPTLPQGDQKSGIERH